MGATNRLRATARAGLVLVAAAAFVVAVYAVIVAGGGALIGRTDAPHAGLSIVATIIVALGFEPMLARVRPWAAQLTQRGRRTPDAVLSTFLDQITSAYPTDKVPARMAELLAEGTGAAYAQVWLVLDGQLTLAQTWPADAAAGTEPPHLVADGPAVAGCRVLPVRHAGELVGVLLVQERDRQPLTPLEQKLFAELAAQAGIVLRSARLRAELARRLSEISSRAAELRASRQRIVAAEDEERRRLERDIHDGAQQHLVALAVNVRLVRTLMARAPQQAAPMLGELRATAAGTVETLTNLARGIYPPLLLEQGLVPALCAAAETSPVPATVTAAPIDRLPAAVEAALYFCCAEALQNAAKHARATHVDIDVHERDATVTVNVADDGTGFAMDAPRSGAGLTNMRDRVEAVGGGLTVASRPGGGTVVTASVPAAQPAPDNSHMATSRSGANADFAR
jgi:signal transduction histidine kinase